MALGVCVYSRFVQWDLTGAEGLWCGLSVLSGTLQLQFCGHFFCFCRQAFPQKHGLAVGKSQQVGEHPKPGAERVLLADVAVNQQPDFF